MKTRKIWMWHGMLPDKLKAKLEAFCEPIIDECSSIVFSYTGTLDNFEDKWGEKFIVMGEYICVTQFNSFGQR